MSAPVGSLRWQLGLLGMTAAGCALGALWWVAYEFGWRADGDED